MRGIKFREIFRLAKVITVFLIFSSSCINDDEVIPDYAGQWKATKSIPGTANYVPVDYYLILSDHTFTETFLTNVDNGRYPIDPKFVTIKGSVSVSEKKIKLIIHKISFSKFNSSTSVVSDPYETYTFDDDDFGFNLEGIGTSTSNHQVEYDIVENQLILKVDYNRDDVFSDNEKSIYIKQ